MLTTLQKRTDGKFSPRSLVQLKNFVRQVSQLNFYEDVEIKRLLSQVHASLTNLPKRGSAALLRSGSGCATSRPWHGPRCSPSTKSRATPASSPSPTIQVRRACARHARVSALTWSLSSSCCASRPREGRLYSATSLWNGEESREREQRLG